MNTFKVFVILKPVGFCWDVSGAPIFRSLTLQRHRLEIAVLDFLLSGMIFIITQ